VIRLGSVQLAGRLALLLDAPAGLDAVVARLGRFGDRAGRLLFLPARAARDALEVRLGGLQPSRQLRTLIPEFPRLGDDPRLLGLDEIALLDEKGLDAPADFRAEPHFLNFDNAREA